MRELTRRVDAWMFGAYRAAPADLALYRVGYAAWVLVAVVPAGLWIDRLPQAFFSPPPGLAALARGFPPAGVMTALNAVLVVLLGLLLVGWRTPRVSVATGVLLLLIKTWEYAPGKINHDILLVLIPLVMAGSGWGTALSVDARRPGAAGPDPLRPRPAWSLALAAFVIGMAMLGAGVLKLITGWLDPSTQSTYGHLVTNVVVTGRHTLLSGPALAWRSPAFWEVADWMAVLLETGAVLAMFRAGAFRVFLALACLFHLGVWVLFDILFSANVVAYAAFLHPARLLSRRPWARAALAPGWGPSPPAACLALAAAWCTGAAALLLEAPIEDAMALQLQELLIVAGAGVGAWWLSRPLWRGRR